MTELKAKRSSTTVTIEKTCEAPILCDEVEIEQVLINLINKLSNILGNLISLRIL